MASFARKVGFRYLRAKKGSSFLSLITGISVGGVAIGVLTLIVTLAVMAGFERELKGRLYQAETHILIEPTEGTIKKDDQMRAAIESASPYVRAVQPVVHTEVILRAGRRVNGTVIKGIGPTQRAWLDENIQEKADPDVLARVSDSEKVWVGGELALSMGIAAGDKVTLVSPVEAEGPMNAVPRVKQVFVAGIYRTKVPEQEMHVVFAPMEAVESFLRRDGVWTQIEIKLDSLDHALVATQSIRNALHIEKEDPLAKLLVRPWQELNEHLFKSLKLERAAMFGILVFIVIVASFNIVSTLTMMVIEKRRSLSILRAMGATPRQIARVFLWEGAAIGITGVGAGGGIALLLCWLLSKYPVIELPEFYYDRSLPIVVDPAMVGLVLVTAIVIVMAGAWVPSKKASELTPIDGIRDSR